ncbi:MAG: hypothetical protein ABI169_09730, partial [Chitinophagaceae bacterium]
KLVGTIVKAHFNFYRHFGMWLKHRKAAQKIVQDPNGASRYPRSIVWDYFAKSKKKFTDLDWNPERL